jgi:conjugal transfer/type IV secretion protein DotA/TraY
MKYLLLLMSLLLPQFANAQEVANLSQYQPAEGSKAMVILSSIFGQLGSFGANGGDPFAGVISTFNGAVLVIGGFLVFYALVLGILGTAQDGEMFGKKINATMWPIRTALGTAMVVPLGSAGYCGIQYLVGFLISTSIGIADKTWVSFVDSGNLGNAISVGLVRPDTKQLGYTVLQSQVCLEAYKKLTKTPAAINLGGNNSNFGTNITSNRDFLIYQYGDTNKQNGFTYTTCGTVKIPRVQPIVEAPADHSLFGNKTLEAESQARNQRILDKSMEQFKVLESAMKSKASSLVNGGAVNPTEIDTIINTYELAVRKVASDEIMAIDAFKEVSANASQDGFLGIAFFYQKLTYLSDLVSRSMANAPVATPPVIAENMYKDQYVLENAKLMDVLSKTQKAQNYGVSYELGGSNSLNSVNSDSDYDINSKLKDIFSLDPQSWVLSKNEHPVMAVKRLGNGMLLLSGGGFIAGEMASMAASNLQVAGYGVGEPLSRAIHDATMVVSMALAGTGFLLSYIVPFTPTVLILAAIIGWTIACIEAIIIAPVWAIMHLTAGGDDFVGSGRQGYRIILNLLLKPVLLVFGVIASLVLLPVFGNLIATIFGDTFRNMNQDTNFVIYITSLIFGPLIYGGLVFMVIKRLFNATIEIPDNIMSWITNSDQTLGTSAKQIAGGDGMGGNGGYATAATAAVSMASKGGAGMLGAGASAYKQDNKENFDFNKRDERGNAMRQEKFDAITSIDQKVLSGIKGSDLSDKEKMEQAGTYSAFRNLMRENPSFMEKASKAENLNDFNEILNSKPEFYGRSFENVSLTPRQPEPPAQTPTINNEGENQ